MAPVQLRSAIQCSAVQCSAVTCSVGRIYWLHQPDPTRAMGHVMHTVLTSGAVGAIAGAEWLEKEICLSYRGILYVLSCSSSGAFRQR